MWYLFHLIIFCYFNSFQGGRHEKVGWVANSLLGTTRKTLASLSNPPTCAASSSSTSSSSTSIPSCVDTSFTNNSHSNTYNGRSTGARHYTDYSDQLENFSSIKSNGWNWMMTCDHDFLQQQMSYIIRGSESIRECSTSSAGGRGGGRGSEKIELRGRDDVYKIGTTWDGNVESHIWRLTGPGTEGTAPGTEGIGTSSHSRGCIRSFKRPPSLRLLEDVIMPAVGRCCAERGINADGIGAGTGKDSQNLLAAVDEGIAFLRSKYHSIV